MDTNRRYTVKDVEKMEEHAELIRGALIIENVTSIEHNEVINEIAFSIKSYIKANNSSCRVYTQNVALYASKLCSEKDNYFLPDVMVVCDEENSDCNGIHKAPLFVAEVTSDSTRLNDYNIKLDVYRKIGVQEYWIVDLQRKVVNKYLLSEGYAPQIYMHPEPIKVTVFNELYIDLSEVLNWRKS